MPYNADKKLWESKKWWGAMIATLIPIINLIFDLGWNVDEVTRVILPLIAFILGQSWVDAKH